MRPVDRPCFKSVLAAFTVVMWRQLPVQADAPTGRYSIGKDTVADRFTGLEWQQSTAPTAVSWENAKAYCARLGDGWRLPLVKELLTIVDVKRINPAIDVNAFLKAPSSGFWSATPVPLASTDMPRAYKVDFSIGQFAVEDAGTALHARCVRSQ